MSLSLLATTPISSLSSKNPIQTTKRPSAPPSSLEVVKQSSLTISCEQKQSGSEGRNNNAFHGIDRRNVLFGLGGLYGAAATIGTQDRMAIGAPVQPPDLSKCHLAYDDGAKEQVNCCPPYSTANIVDFKPPSHSEALRRRKAAHKLTPDEIAKLNTAIGKMKALDKDDPWNYMQQATIHCTYCNGSFDQVGFPETLLQVHGSWLFLPWHRYYLYFWERILGKLVVDPSFALPYWNWDNPEGMRMPSLYLDNSSNLYDEKRNENHYSALMDYAFKFGAPNPTPAQEPEVVTTNLRKIYNMYTEGVGRPDLFMGAPLKAGEANKNVAGSLENLHNIPHMWTGPEAEPNHDMGNFATAARDTMFFGHHANVDRLWSGYRALRGGKLEFDDPDWLDAAFIFYDENRQVVKVKVRDCLETENLGYTYHQEKSLWKDTRRSYKKLLSRKMKQVVKEAQSKLGRVNVSEFGTAPRLLDNKIRALVRRPKTSRSKNEKEDELEVLVIDDIEFDHGRHARFDVHIAKPLNGASIGSDLGEHAGSFIRIPHSHGKKHITGKISKLEVGITHLLDDIEAESSESLVVTLVPCEGNVTIGGVHIELVETDL